jgi:hypothetical protein
MNPLQQRIEREMRIYGDGQLTIQNEGPRAEPA